MRRTVCPAITLVVLLSLLVACSPAAPTVAPTKPSAPAALTAAPPPTSAATTAPAAATKPPAPTTTPVPKVKRGGTLVTVLDTTNSWDPILQITGSGAMAPIGLYETLVRFNIVDESTGKSEYVGELAESWDIVDPLTIVFKLRKGVKYHDGSDFNAEAAKWVIERAKTHPKSTVKVWGAFIKSVDVVDPSTLRLNLAYPSGLFLPSLTDLSGGTGSGWASMLSRTAVERFGDEYGNNPVGTGGVQFVQWLRDDRFITKKWPGYWKKGVDGQPLPYYDGLVSRQVLDQAVTVVELRTGNVHATIGIDPAQFANIKANPDLVLQLLPWAPDRHVYGFNQHRPPFANNLKLRQAAQYAIDRKSIADALGMGNFLPNYYVLWIPGWPGWDETLPRYDYNPDKAKALLKEAGYPDGLEFSFISYPTSIHKRPAEMVQFQWDQVGLHAKLDVLDQVAARSKQKALEFEAASWAMTSSLDPAQYDRMYTCEGTANWSSYCNPEMDKCMAEGGRLYEFEKRAEVYKRCIKIAYDDALVGGVHLRPGVLVYRKELMGVKAQAFTLDLSEAWLDK